MFELYIGAYLPHGETYLTADGNGAAVWLPPGAELLTAEQEEAFVRRPRGPRAGRRRPLLPAGRGVRPTPPGEPLYYCQFLSTVPAYQGRGIGSMFLRDMLDGPTDGHAGVPRGDLTA